jgi:serine/threonine protein kinase
LDVAQGWLEVLRAAGCIMADLAKRCTVVSTAPVGCGRSSRVVRATLAAPEPRKQTSDAVLKIAQRECEATLVNELQKLSYLSRQGQDMQQHLVASHGLHELTVDGSIGLALVLDYVANGDLEEHVQRGGMPEVDARPVVKQILSALELIHAYGVVHLDVKPGNILCERTDRELRVRLCDFGLAMFLDDADLVPRGCGTPGFIAPELLATGPALTNKADCFSLGVTVFWMVTGTSPFGAAESQREALELSRRGFSAEGASLSSQLQDLLSSLGRADRRTRLAAHEALAHPWFTVPHAPPTPKARAAHPISRRFQ